MGDETLENVAFVAGMVSTILFSLVYFPQMMLNYNRQSTTGLSPTSLIIKLLGGAFLLVNAYWVSEPVPVICYGLFGFSMYSILIGQIGYYGKQPTLYLWLAFPLVPYVLVTLYPETQALTNSIKPLTQIGSHLTQMRVFYQRKTCDGVSLDSQHINLLGAALGYFMCLILTPKNTSTWFLYYNSFFQASTFYAAVLYYDGLPVFLRSSKLTSWLAHKTGSTGSLRL